MDPTFPSSTKKKIKNFLTVELGLIYFYKRNLFFLAKYNFKDTVIYGIYVWRFCNIDYAYA